MTDVLTDQLQMIEAAGPQAVADYWKVFERDGGELTTALLDALRETPQFGPIIAAMSAEDLQTQSAESNARTRAALFDGEWGPYVTELRAQGGMYAQAGLEFSEWFRLISLFRSFFRPRLVEAYQDDPQRMAGALDVMNTIIDIGLMVIGEEYLEVKQRKIAEQAAVQRASDAKTEFLSRMSHELRTPLNAILGFAQLLELDGGLSPGQERSVEHILKAGDHLLQLVNEVLDIARIESGRLTVSLEPVPVAEVVAEAAGLVESLARRRRVELATEECDQDIFAFADRQRLKQVILNLLSNGLKFNHPGGRLDVTCKTEGSSVRLMVKDTGPGIPLEQLDRLFQPFERLGASPDVEGTGLGLALSKRLVELMGGRIGVDTSPAGSTFWVVLPIAEQPPHEAPDGPDRLVTRVTGESLGTILYVEDNLANLSLIETILERRPVKMIAAMQGAMGVELAREHHPDLVLLDLHLPDLPGLEVLAQLRSHPKTRDIPVVVISADATVGQIARAKQAGAREYVTKPIDVVKFLGVVDELLA